MAFIRRNFDPDRALQQAQRQDAQRRQAADLDEQRLMDVQQQVGMRDGRMPQQDYERFEKNQMSKAKQQMLQRISEAWPSLSAFDYTEADNMAREDEQFAEALKMAYQQGEEVKANKRKPKMMPPPPQPLEPVRRQNLNQSVRVLDVRPIGEPAFDPHQTQQLVPYQEPVPMQIQQQQPDLTRSLMVMQQEQSDLKQILQMMLLQQQQPKQPSALEMMLLMQMMSQSNHQVAQPDTSQQLIIQQMQQRIDRLSGELAQNQPQVDPQLELLKQQTELLRQQVQQLERARPAALLSPGFAGARLQPQFGADFVPLDAFSPQFRADGEGQGYVPTKSAAQAKPPSQLGTGTGASLADLKARNDARWRLIQAVDEQYGV